MLQNLVGDSQEIFTNEPEAKIESTSSAFDNIFGDTSQSNQTTTPETTETKSEETESTEDLFAELFSEEELKKMNETEIKKDDEIEEIKPKGKKYNIEFF